MIEKKREGQGQVEGKKSRKLISQGLRTQRGKHETETQESDILV